MLTIWKTIENLANIYLFKVNQRNTSKRCETCSKLTIKTPERRHVTLVFLLLTLNIFHTFSLCFHCWIWASKSCQDFFNLLFLLLPSKSYILSGSVNFIFIPRTFYLGLRYESYDQISMEQPLYGRKVLSKNSFGIVLKWS